MTVAGAEPWSSEPHDYGAISHHSESVQCLIANRYPTGLASKLNNCLGSQISAFFPPPSSFKSHSYMEYSTQLAVV